MIPADNDWGKCGFILKNGGQFYGQPRKRWFVLDVRGLMLRYYDDAGAESKLLGEIDLTPDRCTVVAALGSEKGVHALDLVTPGRTFQLRFTSLEEEESWWSAMLRAQQEAKQRCIDEAGGVQGYVSQMRRQPTANDLNSGDAAVPAEASGMGPKMLATARLAYEQVMNAIIRPPRAEYAIADLGPQRFSFLGVDYRRVDAELVNNRGQLLCYSVWEGVNEECEDEKMKRVERKPAVIYMHGNASGRVEAIATMSLVLSLGCVPVAIDCAGSGLSDGDYVSLGHFEQDDLKTLVSHLRAPPAGIQHRAVGPNVAVWGRSMGAEAGLLWASTRDPSASCLILDSPFQSFETLALDIVAKAAPNVPAMVSRLVLRWLNNAVRQRANFELTDVDCLRAAPVCRTPALYVAGKNDDFVLPTHAQALYRAHGTHFKTFGSSPGDADAPGSFIGLNMFTKAASRSFFGAPGSTTQPLESCREGTFKELVVCDGEHNTPRNLETYARIEAFLRCHLFPEGKRQKSSGSHGVAPVERSERTCSYAARLFGLTLRSRDGGAGPNIASLQPWLLNQVLEAYGRADPSYTPANEDPFGLAAYFVPSEGAASSRSGPAAPSSISDCPPVDLTQTPSQAVTANDDTFVSGMTASRQRQVEGLVGQLFDGLGSVGEDTSSTREETASTVGDDTSSTAADDSNAGRRSEEIPRRRGSEPAQVPKFRGTD